MIYSSKKPVTPGVQRIETQLSKISELNATLSNLREQRNALNREAKQWQEKRNKLHDQIRALREEAQKYREQKDKLLLRANDLKIQLSKVKQEISHRCKFCSELNTEVKQLGVSSVRGNLAKKKFDDLEWKIQTTRLDPAEEKVLIDEVRELEKQLLVYKKSQAKKQKVNSAGSEIEQMRSKADGIYRQLRETFNELNKGREKTAELYKRIDKLKEEADDNHKKFVETKTNADKAHQSFVETLGQLKVVEKELKELDSKIHEGMIRKGLEFKQELSRIAEEKLKSGEKLTFEEFKVLMEMGKI
jgi:uncharacterized coiled-coil DUF342 family protein